jgi:hypothetical protein
MENVLARVGARVESIAIQKNEGNEPMLDHWNVPQFRDSLVASKQFKTGEIDVIVETLTGEVKVREWVSRLRSTRFDNTQIAYIVDALNASQAPLPHADGLLAKIASDFRTNNVSDLYHLDHADLLRPLKDVVASVSRSALN